MTISVTELKARCLEIIREVERERKLIEIVRRGEVVALLLPAISAAHSESRPWERLLGTGELLGSPEQTVLDHADFEAWR